MRLASSTCVSQSALRIAVSRSPKLVSFFFLRGISQRIQWTSLLAQRSIAADHHRGYGRGCCTAVLSEQPLADHGGSSGIGAANPLHDELRLHGPHVSLWRYDVFGAMDAADGAKAFFGDATNRIRVIDTAGKVWSGTVEALNGLTPDYSKLTTVK